MMTAFVNDISSCTIVLMVHFCGVRWGALSPEAQELVLGLLEYNPKKRFTAQQVCLHPFMLSHSDK